MQQEYDKLIWSIDDFPVGFSTPDNFFEYSHQATAVCPDCQEQIEGTAQFWSKTEEGQQWLERVDYEPCGCEGTEI